MKSALYLRVSTDDQASRQLPIDGQRAECRRLLDSRGWHFVAEFSDPGLSGTFGPDRRPGLAAMIAAGKRGELDVVVMWDDSRLARDEHLAGWIRWELGAIRIVTVTSPDASALETGLRSIVAAEQGRQGRAATSRGVRANLRRGGRHGSDALGYRWDGTRYAIEEEGAAIMRDVFRRVLAGESMRSLMRSLGWAHPVLWHRLRNPIYAGGRIIARKVGGIHGRRETPREQWEIVWGTRDPIISREEWDRVQARLDAHKVQPNVGTIALSGLLWCGGCGRKLRLKQWRALVGGRRRFHYRCPGCQTRTALDGATNRVARRLAMSLREPDLAARIRAALEAAYRAGEDTGATKAEIRRLERAEHGLLELVGSDEALDTRTIAKRLAGIQRDLAAARRRLEEMTVATGAIPSTEEIESALVRVAAKVEAIADHPRIDYAARPVLRMFLDRVIVHEDALVLHPGRIVEGLGPLASLGITWRVPRRAA